MPGFLNQPQQVGPYRSENTFVKGLLTDAATDATPNTVLTAASNVHLLRQQGSELILASEPGMERSCLLPPNHVVHGWATRQGILYLLLARVDEQGNATGDGQLGTFPAPDYQYQNSADPTSELVLGGELLNTYRPLQVYYGDNNQARPTDLISRGFNLSLDAPSEIELQDSYDGTLNIIINDRGRNAALLINSGFQVQAPQLGVSGPNSPGRYQIVLRQGSAQTNRYYAADFTSRLRLHPRGNTLGKAQLVDVTEGGKLLAGEYFYYFTYCDADDNETTIFAEVGPVYVLEAPVPAGAHGGLPGQPTLMQVKLALSNLDATLGYVRVSYCRRSGEPEAAALAYQLQAKLRVSAAGTLIFTHTGYAQEIALSADQLLHAAGSISAFTTMCQAGGHLLLGGTQLAAADDSALADFATTVRLGHEQLTLPQVPGLEVSSDAGSSLYQKFSNQQAANTAAGQTPHTDAHAAWVGGYLNPLNSCYRLGYMGGESYAFGVRYVLEDYSVSETYPLAGIDNLTGYYVEGNYFADKAPGFYNSTGWGAQAPADGSNFVQNRGGVYRFPVGKSFGQLQPLVDAGTNSVRILAARVQLPEISPELRRRCIGVQFMRAARRPNCLAQGYLVPTLRALQTNPGDIYDHTNDAFKAIFQGTTVSNLKVLPAPRGVLEALVRDYGTGDKREQNGVFPFSFNQKINHPQAGQSDIIDPRRVAFYAPDALLRPATYLPKLNQQGVQVKLLSTVQAKAAVAYLNPKDIGAGSWSLWKTTAQLGFGTTTVPVMSGKSYWTLDNQGAVNQGQFGSQERYLIGRQPNNDKYLVNAAWEPYVGIQLTTNYDAASLSSGNVPPYGGQEVASTASAWLAKPAAATALLANVYNQGGLLTTEQLSGIYPLESLTYTPITERLSWQELESKLDGNRRLLLFGGDTFVGVTYRRIYRGLPADQRLNASATLTGPVGQVLSLVCETSTNPYARSEDAVSVNATSGASFLPRLGYESQNFNAYRSSEHYTQAETTRYNAGYVAASEDSPLIVQSSARLPDVPFRAQRFDARVWASAVAVDGSFANGYRFLPPLSFKDYDRGLGRIVRLLSVGTNQVLVVHENGVELLGLNEQTLTGQNQAGPVYAQALNLLPPQGRILSRELGCQHPFAVCVTPRGVYGVDATRRCCWHWPLGEGSVKRISDFAVSRQLSPVLQTYAQQAVSLQQLDIRVVYDPVRADVVFSMYQKTAA